MLGSEYLNELLKRFTNDGYEIEENVRVSDVIFSYIASKRIFYGLILPYFHHCYVYLAPNSVQMTLSKVLSIHEMARLYTNNIFHKSSRFLRFRIPITTSIIISEKGFEPDAVKFVGTMKPQPQMGDINNIFLINPLSLEIFYLKRVGLIAWLPLKRASEDTRVHLV